MKQDDLTPGLIVSVPFAAGGMALLMIAMLMTKLNAAPQGKGTQVEIADLIRNGSASFLKTEYTFLLPFVAVVAAFLVGMLEGQDKSPKPWSASEGGWEKGGWQTMICFIVGAALSAGTGYAGMSVATDANVKTMEAAKTGLNQALKVAFSGGAVMGFSVTGMGILGLSVLFIAFAEEGNLGEPIYFMTGFGFGASAIALFARVAGGIYTKAADVGADLVGKVEKDIPEDDPRNPGTIADCVGDNVGDTAGMGADLFESFVGSIVATAALADNNREVALPFWIAGFGMFAAIIGFFCVSTKDDADQKDLLHAIHLGMYVASALVIGFSALVVYLLFDMDDDGEGDLPSVLHSFCARDVVQYALSGRDTCMMGGMALMEKMIGDGMLQSDNLTLTNRTGTFMMVDSMSSTEVYSCAQCEIVTDNLGWSYFGCILIGLVAGIAIGEATEYFTSYAYDPVKSITMAGQMGGAATVMIQGLGMGMFSCVPPLLIIVIAIIACYELASVYGIAIAAVGMLSTLGVTLATDAYGPVADNAGGIAEMTPEEEGATEVVRERTDKLDALGNTTAATGKGFAIGSAVLTALALMSAYSKNAGVTLDLSLNRPLVLAGVLIGGMLPFLFGALTMLSVRKAAAAIIVEVQRQFREIDGLFEGKPGVKCDPQRCVSMCTVHSVREMFLPGVIAVMSPVTVGLLIGANALGGMLIGAISSGFMLGVLMSNAGGAWDNCKKFIENEKPTLNGEKIVKKSDTHKACVVGDTVGDPFKDTSGPSLNILIKLMSIFALVLAPVLKGDWETYVAGIIALVVMLLLTAVGYYYVWVLAPPEPQAKKEDNPTATPREGNGAEAENAA